MYILLRMNKGVNKINIKKLKKFIKDNAVLHIKPNHKQPNNNLQQPCNGKAV